MKKNQTKGISMPFLNKNLFRKMKLILLLISVTFFQLSAVTTHAQDASIKLNLSNVSLKEAIQEIESQTEFVFFYSTEEINLTKKVNINIQNSTITDVLNQVFSDYTYRIENRKILLIPRKEQKDNKISGVVVDANGLPLIGANVIQQGTTNGVITDTNGYFSLEIPANTILEISYIGYLSQVIPVGNRSTLQITLHEDAQKLEEVVVVGYGTLKRKDITGSISSVSSEKLTEVPAVSLNQALQGKSAGVQVTLGNHEPGGDVNILIRGQSSITQSNAPIYVVDGIIMEGTLSNINVNDIASIDILKDASAAAIYGARAANGVVIVTTKRGETGKGKVSFSASTSIQTTSNLPKMLNARQLADIRIEGEANRALDKIYNANPNMSIEEYRTQFHTLKNQYTEKLPSTMFSDAERQTLQDGQSYNWYDQIAQTGIIQDYTVSFSGATDVTNYYISANYFDHRGLIVDSRHKRYAFRVNLEQKVKDWLKIGINSNFTNTKTTTAGSSIAQGIGANPLYPFIVDGKEPLDIKFYTGDGLTNPVLSRNVDNNSESRRYSANVYLLLNFSPNLFLKSSIALDNVNNFSGYFAPSSVKEGQSTEGSASITNHAWMDTMWENTLTYSKLIKRKHSLNAMIGNTIQANVHTGNSQRGTGFATNVLGYNSIQGASEFPAGGQWSIKEKWQIASFIARVNYTFDDKYLLTATGRYDGNSKYGTDNKWGFFPSFAGAWRISNESFMKPVKWINDLKLRVGYGELGNSKLASYASFTKIVPGITVGADREAQNTLQNTDQIMGNSALKWERQRQVNMGIDVTALENRLHASVDIYKTANKDLVLLTPMPVTVGYSNMYTNVGELQNKGIEISIGGRIIDRAVKWDVEFNWSKNVNKLTSLYGGLTERINNVSSPLAAGWWVGKPLGTIYTYRYEGIWQWNDDAELMDTMKDGKVGGDRFYPGENKLADLDGDGQVTGADREIVGYTDPKGYGGFSTNVSYKNFSLSGVFNYVYGNKIFNRSYHEYTLGAGYGWTNLMTDNLDRWSVDNQAGEVPRSHSTNLDRMLISSRLMENGSYLRMKALTLAYDFPQVLIKPLLMTNLRLYVTGENLLTLTQFKGSDPESPGTVEFENYPNSKAIVFGLNVSF